MKIIVILMSLYCFGALATDLSVAFDANPDTYESETSQYDVRSEFQRKEDRQTSQSGEFHRSRVYDPANTLGVGTTAR